jgi:hypothetical protein
VYVVKRCDHPQCGTSFDIPEGESQEVTPVEFWVYSSGRGRKTQPIKIELCSECMEELKDLYTAMQRFDQNKEA